MSKKETDTFHIRIGRKLVAGIKKSPFVQPTERDYCYCAKEELFDMLRKRTHEIF